MPKEVLYVGTYSQRGSQGLYVFDVNRDSLSFTLRQTVTELESPSFFAIHPSGDYLYVVSDGPSLEGHPGGVLSSLAIDRKTGSLKLINQVPAHGRGACHVNFDQSGKWAYVSNYGEGNMVAYPVKKDGSVGDSLQSFRYLGKSVKEDRQEKSHVHSVMVAPDNRHVYVADLGTDKLMIYHLDQRSGKLKAARPASLTPGVGPRHFTFHPSGDYVYVAEELNSSTSVYRRDKETGHLTEIQRIASIPSTFTEANYNADIHTDAAGKFLYVSNRGHNSLVIYSIDPKTGLLTTVGYESTFGGHPRNFMLDDTGELVLVANRDTDNVTVYRRDTATGALTYTGVSLAVPAPVCVRMLRVGE